VLEAEAEARVFQRFRFRIPKAENGFRNRFRSRFRKPKQKSRKLKPKLQGFRETPDSPLPDPDQDPLRPPETAPLVPDRCRAGSARTKPHLQRATLFPEDVAERGDTLRAVSPTSSGTTILASRWEGGRRGPVVRFKEKPSCEPAQRHQGPVGASGRMARHEGPR